MGTLIASTITSTSRMSLHHLTVLFLLLFSISFAFTQGIDCPEENGFEACTYESMDITGTVYNDDGRELTAEELNVVEKSCEDWKNCKIAKNCTNLVNDFTEMCMYPQWYAVQAEECIRNFFYTAHDPDDKDYDKCAQKFDFFENHLEAFRAGKDCFSTIAQKVCNPKSLQYILEHYPLLLNILEGTSESGSCNGLRAKLIAPKCELLTAPLRKNTSLPRQRRLEICRSGVKCLEDSCNYSENRGYTDFSKEYRSQTSRCIRIEKEDTAFWKCAEKVHDSTDFACRREHGKVKESEGYCSYEISIRDCVKTAIMDKCQGADDEDYDDFLSFYYVLADICEE